MKNQTTWNLSLLYSGDEDPSLAKDLKIATKKCQDFREKWSKRDDYLKSADTLREALDEYEDLLANWGISAEVGYYWGLKHALNQDDPEILARVGKIEEQEIRNLNELEFFELRIAKIGEGVQKKMLQSPELAQYKHYLERLFAQAKHHLSEEEEKISNLKVKTSHVNWVRMTERLISKETAVLLGDDGKKKKRNFSEIAPLMQSPQKNIRDQAAKAFHAINAKYADVAESEINSILENKKVEDELRHFDRPDSARHLSDDIDTEVVDVMVETVADSNAISQRYYELKAKLLGQDRLAYHERNVRYGEIPSGLQYDDTVETVRETLESLDNRFAEIFTDFTEKGHIDVFPKQGKTDGAFCTVNMKTSPVYILANFTGVFNDITTLAHETGHGINDVLMSESQNALNFGVSKAIAEVSSTFFEDFVVERFEENAGDETKLAILMNRLNDDISSCFRQVAAYKFEQELHNAFREKGYLSRKEVGALFKRNMEAYMGAAVTQDTGSENWWVYWSHFRSFFYVYSYASGLLISKALRGKVRKDLSFIKEVRGILSSGRSRSPVDVFDSVGINIKNKEFWKEGLSEVERMLEETEDLARKLGKIQK